MTELVLVLAYSQTCSNSKTTSGNVHSVATQDCNPPTCIPCAFLDEVKLIFKFSAIDCSSITPASKRRKIGCVTDYEPHTDTLFGPHGRIRSLKCINQSHGMIGCGLQSQPQLFCFPIQNLKFGQASSALSQEASPAVDCFQDLFESEEGTMAAPWSTRSLPDTSKQTEGITFLRLASMIDVGLRSMICDNIVQTCLDIELLRSSDRPKLAEISPALFSPGYKQVSDIYPQSLTPPARKTDIDNQTIGTIPAKCPYTHHSTRNTADLPSCSLTNVAE